MTLTISPATPDDIPGIVDVWYKVFRAPILLEAFPDTPAVKAWLAESFKRCMVEESRRTRFMVVTDDDSGRKVVSFTRWVNKQGGKDGISHWSSRWGKELGEGMDYDFVDQKFFGPMAKQQEAIMGEKQHLVLEVLGTDPSYHRQGAASKMLQWGREEADRDRLEMYVSASSQGQPLYERFGFAVCKEQLSKETSAAPMMRRIGGVKIGE
ncbi:uncharacterized protein BP5553_04475 [Venustampulla echinocandica]|uniref:N-acetyltransferase domain-containing protein n=1 Tax=Venustampulla echinocandica TaxID=2656787 RepID=A0A370TNE6_9HELO|nr:uncharacterized protein BP5553_04475 [Venustampulla echinocandica]RDL37042.1 hypothetical protein BP5553_04475 [Venustampulla echinocandica]